MRYATSHSWVTGLFSCWSQYPSRYTVMISFRTTMELPIFHLRPEGKAFSKLVKHLQNTHNVIVLIQTKVSSDETTYWCKGFEIPRLEREHHVVKVII